MPEITSCPDCEKKLKVPDNLLGKKVRCPGCSNMFTARAVNGSRDEESAPRLSRSSSRGDAIIERRSSSSGGVRERMDDRPRRRDDEEDRRPRSRWDEDDEDDRRRRRRDEDYDDDYDTRPRDERRKMIGVRMGVNLVIIGSWIALASMGVAIIGGGIMMLIAGASVSSMASRPPGAGGSAGIGGLMAAGIGLCLIYSIVGLMSLAATVLCMVGMGMCMQTPPSRRDSARPLAIAAFSCAAAAVGLYLFAILLNVALNGLGGIFSLPCGPLMLASVILWILFMRSLSFRLRDPNLAGRLMTYLIALIVSWVVSFFVMLIALFAVGMAIFSGLGASSPGGAAAGIGAGVIIVILLWAVILIGSLVMYLWLIFLTQEVRGLIDRSLVRR
jgi:hypothetical protein